MKIVKLILAGYNRLMLSNIKYFEYSPTSPYQLVLGTNGSGKSSILEELSPLPAHHDDFPHGGYKIIEIVKDIHTYRLESKFTGKGTGKHSFLKDDVELNPGATPAVQKELVKQEFGLTADIQSIILGTELFTKMSTARRREIITSLSNNDLSYALGTYNKFRTALRDTQGAYKHVKNRLVVESEKLVTLSDLGGIEERVAELEYEITTLMEIRENNLPERREVMGQLVEKLSLLHNLSVQILKADLTRPEGHVFRSVEDIDFVINGITAKEQTARNLSTHYSTELMELNGFIETLKSSGFTAIEDIRCQIDNLRHELNQPENSFRLFELEGDVRAIRMATENVIPVLADVLHQLPDNSDRKFSPAGKERVGEENRQLLDKIDHLLAERRELQHRVQHIKEEKETECPACLHRWKAALSNVSLEELENKIVMLASKAHELEARVKVNGKYLEEFEEYAKALQNYRWLVNSNPVLGKLWDYLSARGCPFTKPSSNIEILALWQADVEAAENIHRVKEELAKLEDALATCERMGDADTSRYIGRSEELSVKIEEANCEIESCLKELKTLSRFRKEVCNVIEAHAGLQMEIGKTRELINTVIRVNRNGIVRECLSTAQASMATAQTQLNDRKALEDIIDDLKNSSDRLALDSDAFKLITSALSPTEGLIAESLNGFIECFCSQMNEVISQIWTYDLRVMPCSLESGELDYKFPLKVMNERPVSDIAKGSRAQTEVVDFAFKIVAMLYMDFTQWPLLLDEFGSGFDEQHRVNAMNYVKLLIDAKRYSQLFMISHYASSHGSMTQAEVCVLDSTNIVVPMVHNKHVKME